MSITPTTVCNVRAMTPEEIMAPDVVYVGRKMPRHKCQAIRAGSIFGNPFKVGKDGDLDTILTAYEEHIASRDDLIALLPTLQGKRLACWCVDNPAPAANLAEHICHAELLAYMVDACCAEDDVVNDELAIPTIPLA